jgi:hypothetical protein
MTAPLARNYKSDPVVYATAAALLGLELPRPADVDCTDFSTQAQAHSNRYYPHCGAVVGRWLRYRPSRR